MFTYFSPNEMFNNLIFPLITAIIPLILKYFLFDPIASLIKKTWQILTFDVLYHLRRMEIEILSPFFNYLKLAFHYILHSLIIFIIVFAFFTWPAAYTTIPFHFLLVIFSMNTIFAPKWFKHEYLSPLNIPWLSFYQH